MVAWSGLAGSDAYDVLGMGISCIDNADEVAAVGGRPPQAGDQCSLLRIRGHR